MKELKPKIKDLFYSDCNTNVSIDILNFSDPIYIEKGKQGTSNFIENYINH